MAIHVLQYLDTFDQFIRENPVVVMKPFTGAAAAAWQVVAGVREERMGDLARTRSLPAAAPQQGGDFSVSWDLAGWNFQFWTEIPKLGRAVS